MTSVSFIFTQTQDQLLFSLVALWIFGRPSCSGVYRCEMFLHIPHIPPPSSPLSLHPPAFRILKDEFTLFQLSCLPVNIILLI